MRVPKRIHKDVKNVRLKREETKNHYETTLDEGMDFFQVIKDRNVTTSKAEITGHPEKTQTTRVQYSMYEYGQETTSEDILDQFLTTGRKFISADTESSDDTKFDGESYDYEKLKMEYEQQLEYSIKSGKTLNYTEKEESEDTPKKALKRIMDLKRPKNCTKEELSRIGIKAIECLIYDYQRAKDMVTVRKVLSRTWLVFRVWLLIYICLAIVCWCQRGNLVERVLSFTILLIVRVYATNFFQDGAAVVSVASFVSRERELYLRNNITQ